MTPWLTDLELRDATHRTRPSAQARVLTGMGVTFRRRPDGSLLVGRDAISAALMGGKAVATPVANGLNWSKSA
jgi:hypothetical protein